MTIPELAATALAVLTVTAGPAVAAPGNTPDGAVPDHAADGDGARSGADRADAAQNASEDAANASDPAERSANASEDAGPPADLPVPVPDHVSAIHDLIRQHIDGTLDGSLGAAISDVVANDDASTEEANPGSHGTPVNGTARDDEATASPSPRG